MNRWRVMGYDTVAALWKKVGTSTQPKPYPSIALGSIPLAGDEGLLPHVSLWREDRAPIRMTSISEALGRPVDFAEAAEGFIRGFAAVGGVRFDPFIFNKKDLADIEELRRRKYATDAWTIGKKEPGGAPSEGLRPG